MGRKIGFGTAGKQIIAAAFVIAWVALLLIYRAVYVEPREWGAICAAAVTPLACGPRAALLWLQYFYFWGALSLGFGIWSFMGAPLTVCAASVGLGAAGVINYNATWGMVGLALGVWGWVVPGENA